MDMPPLPRREADADPHDLELHDPEVDRVVQQGPAGAFAVAGVATAIVVAIYVAFYFFFYLPRGAVQ